MEHIPYANASLSRKGSRSFVALPLLQSIIANLQPTQVDEYAELDAIYNAANEMLKASMANELLWVRDALKKVEPWKSNVQALDEAIGKYKGYKTTLSVDQLKQVGFTDATDETLASVKAKLAAYAAKTYKTLETDVPAASSSGRYYTSTVKYLEPKAPGADKLLKITDLGASLPTPAADQISKLLDSVPSVKALWEALKAAGVEFPILEHLDGNFAKALWNNDLIEFVRFTPKLPTVTAEMPFSYNLATLLPFYDQVKAILPFSLPVEFKADFSLIPRLAMGADNYWLQSIRAQENRPAAEIFGNSLYLIDDYDVDGTMYDLPELEMDLSLLGSVGAMLGKQDGLGNLYAKLLGGIDLDIDLDLVGDASGKVRLADMLDSLSDFAGSANVLERLADNLFDVINISGSLDMHMGADLGVNVNTNPADRSDLNFLTKLAVDAYQVLAKTTGLPTEFHWNTTPGFTVPIFSFDTANGSWLLNV
jgi:hypothetical protein